MTINKKVLAQAMAHGITLLVAYLAATHGIDMSASMAAVVAGVASMITGPLAGWVVSEGPELESVTTKVLAILAQSGVSPRSVLSGVSKAAADVESVVTSVEGKAASETPASSLQAA